MAYLLKVSQTIDRITDFLGKTFSWLAIPLMLVLFWEVFIRKIVAPTNWAYDLSYMLYGAHFMLVTGFALKYKAHVRTDVLYRRWSAKWQGIVDAVLYFMIFLPGVSVLMWASWQYFYKSWEFKERYMSSPFMPPIYPLKFIMFFAIALLLIQGISELLKSFYAAKYGKWPDDGEQEGSDA